MDESVHRRQLPTRRFSESNGRAHCAATRMKSISSFIVVANKCHSRYRTRISGQRPVAYYPDGSGFSGGSVGVSVIVAVRVGDWVFVGFGVFVKVLLGVDVFVGVLVRVGVLVGVFVFVGVGVSVKVGVGEGVRVRVNNTNSGVFVDGVGLGSCVSC
jgi:hypothetical protein